MMRDFVKERMRDVISQLRSEYDDSLFDNISLAERMYGRYIDGISECYEESIHFGGTIRRNANIIAKILEEYLDTHSSIMFLDSEIHTSDDELNKLVIQSISLYNAGNKALATEKIWDALERIKTFYDKDKKKSADILIEQMADGNAGMKELFDEEFRKLTDIGNGYRIRHHETDKKEITSDEQYEYLYKRCISLLSVACMAVCKC